MVEALVKSKKFKGVEGPLLTIIMDGVGIGGDDSWGAKTHPEYLLPSGKPMHFSFSFRGI